MSEVLLASRREVSEAYQTALRRGQYDLAMFWRVELIDRTVAILNDYNTGDSNQGITEANPGE